MEKKVFHRGLGPLIYFAQIIPASVVSFLCDGKHMHYILCILENYQDGEVSGNFFARVVAR